MWALLAVAALTPAACGGGGHAQGPPKVSVEPPRTLPNHRPASPATHTGGNGGAERGAAQQPTSDPFSEAAGSSEVALVASVRGYVNAIDRRDGRALCKLLAPGALRGIRLPDRGRGCEGAVEASIGRTPTGAAPWRRTTIRRIGPVELDPRDPHAGRVRATVMHRFGGGREPSIEDDLIYLRYGGGRWLVAKPSSTFYRAIGVQNVPLRAIAPP